MPPAFPTRARRFLALLAVIPLLAAAPGVQPASAQPATPQPATPPAERPITDNTVTAGDVATTPLSDLNLKKQGIPPLLLDAEEHPYTLAGLTTCPRLTRAVHDLDAILGDDIDVQVAQKGYPDPGGVAQSVLGSFIPFRGLIRELSGANAQEKKVQAAIYAGTARRSFLKGVGLSKGCRYPARPR